MEKQEKEMTKKTLFRTLLLSYLLILAVSVTAGILLCVSTLGELRRNTRELGQMSMELMDQSICQMEESLRLFGNQIRTRKETVAMVYEQPDLTERSREKIAKLISELNRQSAWNPYAAEIFLWFFNPQLTVSTDGTAKGEEGLFFLLQDKLRLNREELLAQLKQTGKNAVFLTGKEKQGSAEQAVFLIKPEKGEGLSRDLILIQISKNAFLELLGGGTDELLLGQNRVFWLQSKANGMILAPARAGDLCETEEVRNITVQETGKATEPIRIRRDGQDLAVMAYDTGRDFIIYASMDYSSYAALEDRQIRTMLLVGIVYLLAGLALICYETRKNYRPVRNLSELVSGKVPVAAEDELSALESGIRSLIDASDDLELEKQRRKKEEKEKKIRRLLTHSWEGNAFHRITEECGLAFPVDEIVTAAVFLKQTEFLFFHEEESRPEDRELALFAIESVAEELFEKTGNCTACMHEDICYLLLTPDRSYEGNYFQESVMETAVELEEFLKERLGIPVFCYISEVTPLEDGKGIHRAYKECQWGREQISGYKLKTAVNLGETIRRQICAGQSSGLQEANQIRAELLGALREGSISKADRCYLQYRARELEFSDFSFAAVRSRSLILAGYLFSVLPEDLQKEEKAEMENWRRRIRKGQTDEQLTEDMHQFFRFYAGLSRQVIREEEQEKNEEITGLAFMARQYISLHYAEENLTVSSLAEAMHVSSSYLSRMYQKQYNCGPLQEIHLHRLTMAKEILSQDESSTLDQIAGQVGYANSLALIRTFRKYEGCTPTEYRTRGKTGQ